MEPDLVPDNQHPRATHQFDGSTVDIEEFHVSDDESLIRDSTIGYSFTLASLYSAAVTKQAKA